MTSEVVLLILILCLIKCTWCANYGFAMGKRHSNDQILHQELLSNKNDSNETIIEYLYTAQKPVTYMQLCTDTNIYTEVTFINSTEIFIKLSNFENIKFNATLTVWGFPWHPDGPEPDDIQFLLQPNPNKAIYFHNKIVEESGIIATNGAYLSHEINSKTGNDNPVDENDSRNIVDNGFYDDTADKGKPESIINPILVAVSQSVVVKVHFFIYIIISIVFVLVI